MQTLITGNITNLVIGSFINHNHPLLDGGDKIVKRNAKGQFKRIRKTFLLDNFDDGYIDADGRFRVYYPNHPRAYDEGYILRSIIAYELYHNIKVPKTMAIHHIDGNRLNDSKENLLMMLFSQHSTFHNAKNRKKSLMERVCNHCKKKFYINRWRLKEKSRGKYCSQKCYHSHKRTKKHRNNISMGLKKAYKEGRRGG